MSDRYYIFSDETGHWSDKDYYIRAWVILSQNEYFKLQSKIDLFKRINEIKKELKYSPGYDYNFFEDIQYDVYYTVTFAKKFREINYQLIEKIKEINNEFFDINGSNIKEKIADVIKHSIFLNVYEYYHVENIFKYLGEKYFGKEFMFFVDSPQYQNRDWKNIFKKFSNAKKLVIVNDSEKCPGVQFADLLVGNMNRIFEKLENGTDFSNFEKLTFKKMSQQNGSEKPFLNNPNIVMWNDGYQELIDKICKIKEGIEDETKTN